VLDKFSWLHFAVGIVANFFSVGFVNFLVLHATFELTENSPWGVNFIDKHLPIWPGGKNLDSPMNVLGHQTSAW